MRTVNPSTTRSAKIAYGTTDPARAGTKGDLSKLNIIPISPAQLTADTNDWAPSGHSSAGVVRFSTDATRTLTGFRAPIPVDERLLILANIGTNDLVLAHDTTSTAGYRFYLPDDTDVTIGPGAAAWLLYDAISFRWRLIGTAGGGGTGGSGGGGGSLTSERFVAAGGTPETFTLAATPTGDIIVFVNGVEQDPDDVTVTGPDVDVNTTTGDIVVIVYGSGTGGGGVIAVRAYHSTTQAISAGATITPNMDSTEYDYATTPMHDDSTDNERLTLPVTGLYAVTWRGHAPVDTTSDPQVAAWLRLNGTTDLVGSAAGANVAGAQDLPSIELLIHDTWLFTAGDYIEAQVYSANAITFGHAGAALRTTMSAVYLGALA